jgi:hypothetical protein
MAEGAKKEVHGKYEWEKSRVESAANFLFISKAPVKVTNPAGDTVKESITPAQVEKLRAKIGGLQILRLASAAMAGSAQEPTMPVLLSRRTRTTTKTRKEPESRPSLVGSPHRTRRVG